jgi:hypothetical protein
MQELSTKTKTNAPATQPNGKLNIDAAREGLAHLMDGLRMIQNAGGKLSRAVILFDGKICQLPMIELPGHVLGIAMTEVMEKGRPAQKAVFTTDGVSVMEALPVMDPTPPVMEAGHGKEEAGHG